MTTSALIETSFCEYELQKTVVIERLKEGTVHEKEPIKISIGRSKVMIENDGEGTTYVNTKIAIPDNSEQDPIISVQQGRKISQLYLDGCYECIPLERKNFIKTPSCLLQYGLDGNLCSFSISLKRKQGCTEENSSAEKRFQGLRDVERVALDSKDSQESREDEDEGDDDNEEEENESDKLGEGSSSRNPGIEDVSDTDGE